MMIPSHSLTYDPLLSEKEEFVQFVFPSFGAHFPTKASWKCGERMCVVSVVVINYTISPFTNPHRHKDHSILLCTTMYVPCQYHYCLNFLKQTVAYSIHLTNIGTLRILMYQLLLLTTTTTIHILAPQYIGDHFVLCRVSAPQNFYFILLFFRFRIGTFSYRIHFIALPHN